MHSLLNKPRDTTAWVISATDSFRLGSRKLLSKKGEVEGYNIGGNRQNIEKSMRHLWEADDGYMMCQVDQSGAEALIVSYLCKKGKYRSLFENGIKPHCYLALKLFPDIWKQAFSEKEISEAMAAPVEELKNLTYWKQLDQYIKDTDEWSPDKRYYHFAKKCIHGFSYNMRENTFILSLLAESGGQIVIKKEEAVKFRMAFFQEFPEINGWHFEVFKQAKQNKQLRNLFGFPYNITSYVNENDFKDLIAWAPQSTVACITRNAYIETQKHIVDNKLKWHLLGDCHDSFLGESPESEIVELAKKMKSALEVEMISPVDGVKFRMKAEASVGYNWGSYKEDKNPKGFNKIRL